MYYPDKDIATSKYRLGRLYKNVNKPPIAIKYLEEALKFFKNND
jgi:hypothetical protein